MAAITNINQTLVKAVNDGGFGLPIAYENIKFDKEVSSAYLSVFNIRAPTVQVELSWEGCDQHSGVFQIDINYKQGQGVDVLTQKADEINAVFKNGAVFAGTEESVNISNVSAEPVSIGRGWATISMTINYYVFSRRVQ